VETDPTGLRERLRAALGGSYTLDRELGGGGMARVFLAEETALGRTVVVKVLAPDLMQELSAERFAREIRLSARLQHPSVVPVLTAGTAGGVPYYTMPYVEGQSLRARLDRLAPGDRAPVAEALAVLRDVARALAYAHARGIVHRDIKPENILLSDDAVMVADFGIAKAVDAARAQDARAAPDATLTRLGAAIGTPAYMAPEQAAGDPAVDHRADLYAWGVVAYELLAGRHPFAGKRTPHALIAAHLSEAPAPLDAADPDVPRGLAALVMRCLAKDPTDRPANARELVDVITTPAASDGGRAPQPAPAATPSIAVLPFVNLSADDADEYFSDGVTEEIRNILAHDRALQVAARSSSFAFKGKSVGPRAIAEQLRVRTLLEGSVRRVANRVRITAQLVNAADGFQLWSERFDRELTDIFAVQDEIAGAIAGTLRRTLHGAPVAALDAAPDAAPPAGRDAGASPRAGRRARQPASVEAYDEYLRGRYLNHRRGEGHRAAVAHFQRALALDPTFAPALTGLAEAHLWLAIAMVLPPGEAFTRTRRYAQEALALDPELAAAHYLLGEIAFWHEWDPDACERHVRRALALEPGSAETLQLSARLHLIRGETQPALADADAAVCADPVNLGTWWYAIVIAYCAGAFDRAVAVADRVLAENPGFVEALRWRGKARCMLGDVDGGLADLQRALDAGNRLPFLTAEIAAALCLTGRFEDARRIRDELVERSTRGWIPPSAIALAEHFLGNTDAAFRSLERALETRDFLCVALQIEPQFLQVVPPGHSGPIVDDPRWSDFVRRVGMAP
jgi:serine/threonine-protein kinase